MVSKKLLNKTVCVVGPGYVGLPLAQDFSEHIRTIGYRRDQQKVDELNATLEYSCGDGGSCPDQGGGFCHHRRPDN